MSSALSLATVWEERDNTRYFGKYRAIVTDVKDPDNMGRIRAKVPAVYGDGEASDWAFPVVPFAGRDYGLFLLPEVGDSVWFEFEGGDIEHPLWTGCWWRKGDLPDPKGPAQRVLTSMTGMQLIFDDDAKELSLKHPGGAEIVLADSSITIKLGSKQIEITSTSVNVNSGALEVS